MNHPDWQLLAEKAALYLYPRRCPFCGAVLGRDAVQGTVCPACFEAADKRLVHLPPRLPETEHAFYALNSAVAAYYYSGEVRHAILACKRGGELWRARELADRMAVLIWGAMPSHTPGRRPAALAPVGMPRYHYIVPVPPREPLPGTAGMPLLLARRLGILMQTPVLAPLYSTKPLQPQKELTRAERLANKKDAYACRPGTDLSGKRVLLVDDIITTGANTLGADSAEVQAAQAALDDFSACLEAVQNGSKKQSLTSLPYYQGSAMHALCQANEALGTVIDQLYAKMQEQAADPMKMGAVQGQYGQFNSAGTIIGNLQYNDAVYEYQNDVGGFPASMLGRLFGVQEVEPFA